MPGEFLAWIEAEFGMGQSTAYRFIQAAESTVGQLPTVGSLPASILYALTSPSTPEPIREEGFHRLAAAREAELETIACEVRPGSIRDAILHSAGANATHGLRRSNEDKRRAVTILLEDEEWSKWSGSSIAKQCAVAHSFVSRLKASLVSETSEAAPRTYQDRHGNVTQMRTSAIGRRPADAPEPEAPTEPPSPADIPAPPEPSADPTNVVALAPRLTPLPTPEATARAGLNRVTNPPAL